MNISASGVSGKQRTSRNYVSRLFSASGVAQWEEPADSRPPRRPQVSRGILIDYGTRRRCPSEISPLHSTAFVTPSNTCVSVCPFTRHPPFTLRSTFAHPFKQRGRRRRGREGNFSFALLQTFGAGMTGTGEMQSES